MAGLCRERWQPLPRLQRARSLIMSPAHSSNACPVRQSRKKAGLALVHLVLWSLLRSTHRSESRNLVDLLFVVDLGTRRAVHIANRPTAVSVSYRGVHSLLAQRVPSGGGCRANGRGLVAHAEAETGRPGEADGAASSRRLLGHYKALRRIRMRLMRMTRRSLGRWCESVV